MNLESCQTFSSIVLWVGIALTAAGTIGSQYIAKRVERQKEQKANDKQQELISQNQKLLEKIELYQRDLLEKDKEIKELDRKAKIASRGITSIYDFNGTKRQTTPGSAKVSVGPEYDVFKQMVELEKAKDFSKLIELCEEQIKKTPDWLTPYLFLGVAYANTGEKDKAIANLRYVVDNAPGDPAYAQAEKLLQQLEGIP
jgi:tetratricopeptide (TPR) repeat protein